MNAVLMFSLVWAFTVCQADEDGCSINCDDVTGTVGTEVTFTCSVPQTCTKCCVKMYKFQYPENNDSEICRQNPEDSCDQRNTFTCSFTPTTAMKKQFRFFLQKQCGAGRAEFTVDITERSSIIEDSPEPPDTLSKGKVNSSAVVVSIIIIILIIVLAIINFKKQCFGLVRPDMFQCFRQAEDKQKITV